MLLSSLYGLYKASDGVANDLNPKVGGPGLPGNIVEQQQQ